MMLHFREPAKLKTKKIVFEEAYAARDSTTLEQLKELSSKRRMIEESINESSSITTAIAREMSGGLTSRSQQVLHNLEMYLPLLENLIFHVGMISDFGQIVRWNSELKMQWTSALSSSSFFNFKGPKYFQINSLQFEIGMILFLYGAILRERALEVLPADLVQSATLFREAAGVFHHLAHKVLPILQYSLTAERPPEVVSSVSTIMSLICLAEAQAVTTKRAEEKGTTVGLLAKLHHGVAELLDEAAGVLNTASRECNDISSGIVEFISCCKALHELKSKKYFAESLKIANQFGAAIGVLRVALVDVKKKKMPGQESWKYVLKEEIDRDSPCTSRLVNTTFDYDRFAYVQAVRNLTLFYGCVPQNQSIANNFTCKIESTQKDLAYYVDDSISRLNPRQNQTSCLYNIRVPIMWTGVDLLPENYTVEELKRVLKRGFQVEYEAEWELCGPCMRSNGTCGSNTTTDSFLCFCGGHPYEETCPSSGDNPWNWKRKVPIGVGTSAATVLIMCVVFFIYQRRNRKQYAPSSFVSRSIFSKQTSMDDMEKGSTYLGVHLFTYRELEEATNYFDSAKELGDGGFGTVYHGNVRDGRAVAVKRLYENNCKRVEQFMNEIEILARLRHQNLVLLYGCTSRHSRELLLVYEYIPNGTLAEHLHGERAKPGALRWLTRMNIAIETASALSYLHASDIIHRDVKTTNILLDNNFCVKVADFGLSRLFPTDVTHISTAPQGTPGYVDPEYNQCYQLTSKSDVYSFGVVMIELISSLPAVDITRHRHEINLSNMAINKIQNHALHELVDTCLGFESNYRIRKMIIAVAELAFRCLQSDKDVRPSMPDVLDELKRIQSKDFDKEKAEEIDISADNVVLLKSDPLPPPPLNWISSSTTPNGSG